MFVCRHSTKPTMISKWNTNNPTTIGKCKKVFFIFIYKITDMFALKEKPLFERLSFDVELEKEAVNQMVV